MKCPHCGKELKKVGELTEEESQEFIYISEALTNANQALQPEVVDKMPFNEENKLFEYFKAVFEEMGKARFLNYMFFRKLTEKYNARNTLDLYVNKETTKFIVYSH